MAAKKKRRFIWISAILVLAIGSVAFISIKALTRKQAAIDPERLAKVERMDLARLVVATGKIEPTTKVECQLMSGT
jgi:multidrug efflux pump subunit AcrA (membrane-fusion protein)